MKTRKLITEIDKWLKEWEQLTPRNIINDFDDDTIEGSAYNLLARAVKILKANDIADTELKRHGKGLKEAVDKTITI